MKSSYSNACAGSSPTVHPDRMRAIIMATKEQTTKPGAMPQNSARATKPRTPPRPTAEHRGRRHNKRKACRGVNKKEPGSSTELSRASTPAWSAVQVSQHGKRAREPPSQPGKRAREPAIQARRAADRLNLQDDAKLDHIFERDGPGLGVVVRNHLKRAVQRAHDQLVHRPGAALCARERSALVINHALTHRVHERFGHHQRLLHGLQGVSAGR
eukprot:118073-Chlamydomonas_euryale.AAC.1